MSKLFRDWINRLIGSVQVTPEQPKPGKSRSRRSSSRSVHVPVGRIGTRKPGPRKRSNLGGNRPRPSTSRRRPATPKIPGRSTVTRRQAPRSNKINNGGHSRRNRRGRLVAYHGTPALANVRSILREGWMVGSRNLAGDGIYLTTDWSAAKGYSGATGYIVKCSVDAANARTWDPQLAQRFSQWCLKRGVPQDNSAKTAFLLREIRCDVLLHGKVLIVLSPQYANGAAWKKRLRAVRVISVHKAANGSRVRV